MAPALRLIAHRDNVIDTEGQNGIIAARPDEDAGSWVGIWEDTILASRGTVTAEPIVVPVSVRAFEVLCSRVPAVPKRVQV